MEKIDRSIDEGLNSEVVQDVQETYTLMWGTHAHARTHTHARIGAHTHRQADQLQRGPSVSLLSR